MSIKILLEAIYIEIELIGILLLLSMPLLLGIARGSTICMVTCAPGIMPYLISKEYDWRKCLQLAIVFNLPRIIILSVLGTLVGIIGFSLKGWVTSFLPQVFIPIQVLGYGILGIFILIFGAYMFTTSIDAQEDVKEKKERIETNCETSSVAKKRLKTTQECQNKKDCVNRPNEINDPTKFNEPGILRKIKSRFGKVQNRPKKLFFIWGGILSMACLGEIILIELSVISGSFGFISSSSMEAAFLGGTAMFLFAIGASIPIIIVAVISNPIGKIVRAQGKLESVRTIFGMVMIIVGLWFIFGLLSNVVTFFL